MVAKPPVSVLNAKALGKKEQKKYQPSAYSEVSYARGQSLSSCTDFGKKKKKKTRPRAYSEKEERIFVKQYSTNAKNDTEQSGTGRIKGLLNMDPQCHEEDKPMAHHLFLYNSCTYDIANTSLSE